MTVDLGDMGGLAVVILDECEDAVVEDTGALLRATQRNLTRRGPKKSGRFRGSVVPYHGAPSSGVPPENQAFYPIHGDPEVDAVMSGFQVGDEVGTASGVPYANRLARGWSDQAPDGWVDVAVADAVSEVEAAA